MELLIFIISFIFTYLSFYSIFIGIITIIAIFCLLKINKIDDIWWIRTEKLEHLINILTFYVPNYIYNKYFKKD